MADSASSPATLEHNRQHPESGAPNSFRNQFDPVPAPAPAPPSTQSQSSTPSSSAPVVENPNPNPALASAPLPPPPPRPSSIPYAAAGPQQVSGVVAAVLPPSMPSFRPLFPQARQFSPLPNPGGVTNLTYQNPAVPPPGVAGGTTAVPVSMPPMQPMMAYQVPSGQPANLALRPFVPMSNGYTAAPQGTIPPAVS